MQPQTISQATSWWQLKIPVPTHLAEDAGASLMEAGSLGVVMQETPQQTYIVACYSVDATTDTLVHDAVTALADVGVSVGPNDVDLSQQNDSDWSERWKQYFKPMKIGRRLWVVPSWERQFLNPTGSIVLHLDPGSAFGTGQHGTTVLCLRAIEMVFEGMDVALRHKMRVLDVGCGSGILALAAAKLGAGQVLALDHDPAAIAATQFNAEQNLVAPQLHTASTALSDVPGTYHLIVANIFAATLMDMAPMLVRRLAPGGHMVLSGILREQADAVVTHVLKAGDRAGTTLRHGKTWTHGQWIALQFLL